MNKICTTIEQSQKLMELGIDISTADMYFHPYPNDEYWYDVPNIGTAVLKYNQLPCWSLNALLELMPKDESKTISLCLGGSNGIDHTFDWFCTCDENDEPYDYKTFHSKSPIDAAFQMICWLKENNKL